jgi:hypothetical protein
MSSVDAVSNQVNGQEARFRKTCNGRGSVSVYIYSSAKRRGDQFDDEQVLVKVNIERHVRQLGEKGLQLMDVCITLYIYKGWLIMQVSSCRISILRPAFFMENYDGKILRFHNCQCSESWSQTHDSHCFDCESRPSCQPRRQLYPCRQQRILIELRRSSLRSVTST